MTSTTERSTDHSHLMRAHSARTARAANPVEFRSGALTVYFQSKRAGLDGRLETRLTEFIDATTDSLDCAIYDLRDETVLAALKRVVDAGKQVRIAYDAGKQPTTRRLATMADPKPGTTTDAIQAAGLGDVATAVHSGRHLMHDKFLVRDGQAVWSGSANFTVGGLTLQDNNCLAIDSAELAARYAATFENLIGTHRHTRQLRHPGQRSPLNAPIDLGGGITLAPYFAPAAGEGVEEVVVEDVANAHKIRVLAFLISDPGILQALEPWAENPDLDIRGIYDPGGMQDVLRSTRQAPDLFWFVTDHRFVKARSHAFNPQRENDFMHNKVLIIDDRVVLTGSYNFSENAELNDENLLRIESEEVAAAYTRYFDALYTNAGGLE